MEIDLFTTQSCYAVADWWESDIKDDRPHLKLKKKTRNSDFWATCDFSSMVDQFYPGLGL